MKLVNHKELISSMTYDLVILMYSHLIDDVKPFVIEHDLEYLGTLYELDRVTLQFRKNDEPYNILCKDIYHFRLNN